jgi:hypothetical protein
MHCTGNLDEEVCSIVDAGISLSLDLGESLSLDFCNIDDAFVNITALILEVITDLVLVKLIGTGFSYLIVDAIVLLEAV